MTILWIIAAIVLIVAGWHVYEGRWDSGLFRAEPGRVCVNLRPQEARAFLNEHADAQVLDVRSDAEFRGGALPGAIQISLGDAEFSQKVARLDNSKPVLVYCAGGFRSRKAVGILKAQGFSNIQHLHRGFHSWRLAGMPVTRESSSHAR
jgi:rhodanese-related sulfurtransferase